MAISLEKEAFIKRMQQRIHILVRETLQTINDINYSIANKVILHQLIKSVTSIGANYRSSCLARSQNEFYSKISIVVEEADETLYWLQLLKDLNVTKNPTKLDTLINECEEIFKIVLTAKSKKYRNH